MTREDGKELRISLGAWNFRAALTKEVQNKPMNDNSDYHEHKVGYHASRIGLSTVGMIVAAGAGLHLAEWIEAQGPILMLGFFLSMVVIAVVLSVGLARHAVAAVHHLGHLE